MIEQNENQRKKTKIASSAFGKEEESKEMVIERGEQRKTNPKLKEGFFKTPFFFWKSNGKSAINYDFILLLALFFSISSDHA
jgi:hypothetical protein